MSSKALALANNIPAHQHSDDDDSSDPEFADFDHERMPYGREDEPEENIDFWAVNIAPGATHEESLELGQSLTVRHAALPAKAGEGLNTLSVTIQDEEYALCTLSKNCPQYALKLIFSDAESPIKFTNSGSSKVSLIGYQQSIEFGDLDFDDEISEGVDQELGEEVTSEESESEKVPSKPVTQQKNQQVKQEKPKQQNQQNQQKPKQVKVTEEKPKTPQPVKTEGKPAQNGATTTPNSENKKKSKKNKNKFATSPATNGKDANTPAKGKEEANTSNPANKTDESTNKGQTPTNGKRPNERSNTPAAKKIKISS